MSRPLSAQESQLILRLEWEKQPVVTIEETMAILGISYDQACQVLYRLAVVVGWPRSCQANTS